MTTSTPTITTAPAPTIQRQLIFLDWMVALCECAPGRVATEITLVMSPADAEMLRAVREMVEKAAGGRR